MIFDSELKKARERVEVLRRRLDEARGKLTPANEDLVRAVAFSDGDKSVAKRRALVERLRREAEELEQAIPLAEQRVAEIEQRDREKRCDAALAHLRDEMATRRSVLARMDEAWRRLANAYDELTRADAAVLAATKTARALGATSLGDGAPLPGHSVPIVRRAHAKAAHHHAHAYARLLKLPFVEPGRWAPLEESLGGVVSSPDDAEEPATELDEHEEEEHEQQSERREA